MKSLRNVCLSGFERVKCPSHADFLFISPEDFIQNEVETWARICKTVAGVNIFSFLSQREEFRYFLSQLYTQTKLLRQIRQMALSRFH